MTLKLMDENRLDKLMKVAADCIGLMNIGVSPNAALKKLAEDEELKDKEIELVSHAVNNSKQLAHLQTSSPDEKEAPFPLTNAEVVIHDLHASEKEVLGDSTEEKQDQPDAVDIKETLDKEAASSYTDSGNYFERKQYQPEDLRTLWDIKTPSKLPEYVRDTTYAREQQSKFAMGEAGMNALVAQETVTNNILKLAEHFRQPVHVDWNVFEKAAKVNGVHELILDSLYEDASKFGCVRADVGEDRLYVSSELMEKVNLAKTASVAMEDAINWGAVKLALVKEASDAAGGAAIKLDFSPGGLQEPIAGGMRDFLGLPDTVAPHQRVSDILGDVVGEGEEISAKLSPTFEHELKDYGARSGIQDLMKDTYIGGHTLPEVVEAYNSAVGANSHFSYPEMVAYIRQYLATQGGMPLETLIRSRSKEQV